MIRVFAESGEDAFYRRDPIILDGDPRASTALIAASELTLDSPSGRVLNRLAEDIDSAGVLSGVDGLSSWGPEAVELLNGSAPDLGVEFRFGRTLDRPFLELSRFGTTEAVAWQEQGMAIADLAGVSGLTVIDDTAAQDLREFPLDEFFGAQDLAELEVGVFIDWRAYLGSGTLVSEGQDELEPDGEGRAGIRLSFPERAGIWIGTVLRWIGKPRRPQHDVSFRARLRYYANRYPDIAGSALDLSEAARRVSFEGLPPEEPAIIVVHGTFSCCIPILERLGSVPATTYRFEHDTFVPILDNAEELARLVGECFNPMPLLFLGHSRGGLVARHAANLVSEQVWKNRSSLDLEVRTYGTPHEGTPLADAGNRAFRAFASAARVGVAAVTADPATAALKLILRPKDLPEGLTEMRVGAPTLRLLKDWPSSYPTVSWGGVYDWKSLPDGRWAQFKRGLWEATFGGKESDLVVPTASATAVGRPRQLRESCGHSQYFDRLKVQEDISSFGLRSE